MADINVAAVTSSPMMAKPAIKRKSPNGSLKGGVAPVTANGGGVRQNQIQQVDVVRAYPGQQQQQLQRPSVSVLVGCSGS